MRSVFKSLPQGSVLNPLFFNLYVKDILKIVPYNCRMVQFADDIVIFCQNKFSEKICSINLELSVPKSQFIIFNRARKKILPDQLEATEGVIPRSSTIKYLGIKLDAGLKWRDHINYLKIKVAKYMNILKWLMGRNWGIDPLQAINFVNATILAQVS